MAGIFTSPLVTNGLLAGMTMSLMTIATPAMAEPQLQTSRISISTDNLNLNTAEGRQTLERRVKTAINNMCGAPTVGDRGEAEELRACRADAFAAVQPQLQAALTRASVSVASTR